ncbi:MAG: hypothetical protein CMK59_15130 [Proteobacteria bacterium]|nr:hypothetical protein [Pseudomonadota bacterium]
MPYLSLIALLATGCDRASLYEEDPGLYENVKNTFDDCSEQDIAFLARKFNIQLAFTNCGTNNFSHFSWSPAGNLLYFQLMGGAFILNPESTGVDSLPSSVPLHGAAWINPSLLAIPVAKDGEEKDFGEFGKNTAADILWYNLGGMIDRTILNVYDPQDLQRWGEGNLLLFSAKDKPDGQRKAYVLDGATKELSSPFPFVEDGFNQMSYAYKSKELAILRDDELTVYSETGKKILSYSKVRRVDVHPEGRYIAAEVDGPPIPAVGKSRLVYASKEEEERDLKKMKQEAEKLPDWADKEIIPKAIHIFDIQRGELWSIDHFYGSQVEWYSAKKYYMSFMMHGIDGHLLNQNVALTNVHDGLYDIDQEEPPKRMTLIAKDLLIKDAATP